MDEKIKRLGNLPPDVPHHPDAAGLVMGPDDKIFGKRLPDGSVVAVVRHTLCQLIQGAFSHPAYNERSYEKRGWCCFEEGVAQVVVAILAKQGRMGELPAKHATAETHRPKLIALGEDGPEEHVPTLSSSELLEDVQRRIARALFTGESDRKNVVRQFQTFSSIISRGVAQRAGKRSAKVASEFSGAAPEN